VRDAILLLFLALTPLRHATVMDSVSEQALHEAANKAIAGRVFEEIFNQGKFGVAEEIYDPDFVNHGLHRDYALKEDQAAVHEERRAFPNLTITVDLMVAKGNLVTVVWRFRGTQTASGFGLPPTGATIDMRGITVWRIIHGRIREEWTSFDRLRPALQILTQLRWAVLGILVAALVLGWLAVRGVHRWWSWRHVSNVTS
jgi:predicted ester cyclase